LKEYRNIPIEEAKELKKDEVEAVEASTVEGE
jgi:hypothetical protein